MKEMTEIELMKRQSMNLALLCDGEILIAEDGSALYGTDGSSLLYKHSIHEPWHISVRSLNSVLSENLSVFKSRDPKLNRETTRELPMSVSCELDRAIEKFPEWPDDPLHAVVVLNEEVGELNKAILQATYEPDKSTKSDVENEAIQVAAMALRFLASIENYQYDMSPQHRQEIAKPKPPENIQTKAGPI